MPRFAFLFLTAALGAVATAPVGHAQTPGSEIPSPEDVLGYALGERFTDVAGIERYMETLADASDLVTVERYGETPEGRPLIQVVLASPEHHGRMEEVVRANAELMDPGTPVERAEEIARENPAIAYFTYGIHGDESGGPEAALWTAWDLARGASAVDGVLDDVVVVMDPSANPDGRDRYVNFYRQAALERENPSTQLRERRQPWPGGRFNHYLFDLNRDWAWASQPETRMRLDRYQHWNPQVHIDFHEMGYNRNYFFFPPADPVNPIFPHHTRIWAERFGAANARAFDEEGRLYYTGEDFDLFYPGYGDSWPSLQGAIGMTYEQAGGGAGGRAVERNDGTTLTLEHRARGSWITGKATLREMAAGTEELLEGFAAFHREIDEGIPDYLLVPDGRSDATEALVELLARQGVEVERAGESFEAAAEAHAGFEARSSFPEGTYRVRARQPRGRLAAGLLEPEHDLEGEFSYDITAWSLPYAYGVEAHSVEGTPEAAWAPVRGTATDNGDAGLEERGEFGYLLRPTTASGPGFVRFLEEGGRGFVLPEPFVLNEESFPPGTLFLPQGRNDDLDALVEGAGLTEDVVPVHTARTEEGPDLGTGQGMPIRLPEVALLAGPGTSATSAGVHWFFLERFLDLPFDMLNVGDVNALDLDLYDVIVVPSGGGGLRSELGPEGEEALEGWIRDGGTLVAVDGAARQLADPLAGVEVRRELEVDTEPDREERLEEALRPREVRQRESWMQRVPGTVMEAALDPDHPLSYGAGAAGDRDRVFVLSQGNAFEPVTDVESPVYFPGEDLEEVAGVISQDNLDRLERSAWAVHASRGAGNVILFAEEPLFRMFWYGGFRPYMNAVLLSSAF